jgi:hypothetical protein
LYDNIIESLSRVKNRNSGFGCILAHSMNILENGAKMMIAFSLIEGAILNGEKILLFI